MQIHISVRIVRCAQHRISCDGSSFACLLVWAYVLFISTSDSVPIILPSHTLIYQQPVKGKKGIAMDGLKTITGVPAQENNVLQEWNI